MASEFLRKKALEQAESMNKKPEAQEHKTEGGAMPPSTGSAFFESARASNFLRQRAEKQDPGITQRFGEDSFGGTELHGQENTLAAENLTALMDQIRGLGTPGAAADTPKTSGGYYSRPAVAEGLDGISRQVSYLEPALRQYAAPVETAMSELKKAESDLQIVSSYLERAKAAYDAAPTQRNADVYNQIAAYYDQTYQTYAGKHSTYQEAYGKYSGTEEMVSQILNAYQRYTTGQQAAFDDWRGTIRGGAEIQQELTDVEQLIANQEVAVRQLKGLANFGEEKDEQLYQQAEANLRKMKDLRALLQEEYDWSMYYQYDDLRNAADFAEKSRYATTANGLDAAFNIQTGRYDETGFRDLTYDYINKNADAVERGLVNDSHLGSVDKTYLQQMSDQEIATFNYLYATQGSEAAYQYTDYLAKDLNKRHRMEQEAIWSGWAKEHPVAMSTFSVLTSPLRGLSYLGQAADLIGDGEIDPNATYNKFSYIPNAIRGQVAQKIKEGKWGSVGSFGYQTAMSMADFLFSTVASGGNSSLAMAIMGSGAAADTTLAARERGVDSGKAFALGAVAGIAEAVTEKFSLDALLDPKYLKDGVLKYIGKNMLTEGSEEVASSLINLFTDIMISGDKSEWQQMIDGYMAQGMSEKDAFLKVFGDQALSIGADFLGGAISGGVLGGGNAAVQSRYVNQLASDYGLKNMSENDARKLINASLKSAKDTKSYQLAVELQKKLNAGKLPTARELTQLSLANEAAIQEEPEIERVHLRSLGDESDAAGENAEPEWVQLRKLDDDTETDEVSAEAMRKQAHRDFRAGKITGEEFNTIMDDVMHLEELENGTSVKTFDSEGSLNEQADKFTANTNGGIDNDDARIQYERSAATQSAGERFSYGGTNVPDEVQKRNAGKSAGIEAGQMERSAGGQRTQTDSAAKAAAERQDTASDLRKWGLIRETSSWDLGVDSGTETENVLVMPQDHWDTEMQEAAQMIRAETGKHVTFTVGSLQVNQRGSNRDVRGVNTGKQIIIQCDDAEAGVFQLARHEIFHDKVRGSGPSLIQDLKKEIREKFSPEEFDAVMDRYIDELWAIYGPEDEFSPEGIENAYNTILEEMLADAYAGINAFGAHAEKFAETVNRFLDENSISRKTDQENGVRETNGPPERFSVAETDNGEPVAVVDSDILEGIYDGAWSDAKEELAIKAAVKALKKFRNGVRIGNITYKVNRTTRREYTRSNDAQRQLRKNPVGFADKMRAADVIDDVIVATLNWRQDGSLKHDRKDFSDFCRGDVLISSGAAGYSAEVVVGITRNGEYVLYDITHMIPREISIKNTELSSTATTNDSSGDMLESSAELNLPHPDQTVKDQDGYTERFSVSDTSEVRADMTTKERDILRGVETRLLRDIGGVMGATKFSDRSYLKTVIKALTDTYLQTGTVDQKTMDNLFTQAYEQSIVADREMHDQYEDVRKYLHTTSITLDPRDRSDIADYGEFVKSMRNRLRITDQGGLAVDSAWRELNSMAPALFPESIAHPADQLKRMAEIWDTLRITEKSLNDHYGPEANDFKKWARAEFDWVVWDSVGELRQIRRYEQARQQKLQSEPTPTTPEEAMEAWTKLKTARKTYERAMAKNLLTPEDEMQVGRLLRGEILPEHLDNDRYNVKGILAVYEGKQEYERLVKLLSEYRKKVRADLRADADSYLETANDWKDKKAGIAYSRETMQRNVEDIVPDKAVAKAVNERYFEPIRDAEAAATKLKTEYRDRVRALNLSRDVRKGDLVSEAHAVQLYGEAMDNIRILEKARGRLKQRDGKSLEEWRGVVYKLWQENPGLDKAKIEGAVAKMRQIYDELFVKMNEVRVRWGYEPVNYRQGYFPHFQPGDGDGIMAQFGRALGIDTQVVALPTTINGLTHTFKPGIQWFGNAQERLGFNTAYDAVEGFDSYVEGVASVICQTENIQKLRALATQMRYRTSDEGIRKQVDAVYANPALTEEQKNAVISDIYEHGRFTLSNFVVEVDEYTNLLANKKSKLDRATEALMGRKFYTLMKWLESRVGANMIAGNLTSALTNFIPLTQAGAQTNYVNLLQGMWDTLGSYRTDDGIIGRSAFLTNRRGSDPLVKNWSTKASEVLGKPMEWIDNFVSGSIVRAAYRQNLKRGLSESEAMHQADIFAARVMAERSKGGMPTLFESKNPIFKLATQFQLEVNNQFSEVFKDIPRKYRGKDWKGLAVLAGVLLQYFFGAWLFNNLYEKLVGRRPAMDPIDILVDTVRDFKSEDVSTIDALGNLANNILEEIPFSAALTLVGIETDGGRVPVSSGIPNIPTLVTAATNEDWAPEKRWKEAQDELNKLAYVIPPFGGNQVSKIWKGVKAYIEGGSYSVDSDGNDILQYPLYNDESDDFWGLVQAMLLGKSSLPEAREWVEDGFDSLTAKQTAMYQDMVEAGVDQREAYEFLDSLRAVQETEKESRESLQMKAILDADVPGEAKAIAYYGLLDKDDKNREVMDTLAELGANPGEAAETLIQLRNIKDLKGAEKKAAQADILIRSALTESEKEAVIRSWLDDQEVSESGNLTNLGKFNLAMKQGITTEEYLRFRATGMEIDKLLKYTEAGFEADEAQDLAQAIHDLDPLPGEDEVSDLQKWRASVDFSNDVEDQLTALSMIMEAKSLAVWETANDYGVTPDIYVTFRENGAKHDADGNGSYTQEEAKAAIDAEFSHLTTAQKAVLWQWICYSSGSKKNPYDPAVGQNFIDSRDAAKAATEEEEELEGLTLGSW